MRPLLTTVALLALAAAAPAAAQSACDQLHHEPNAEPRLPPGFDNVSWGMGEAAVQAVRGQPMERQGDLASDDVYYLFEMFEDRSSTVRVRYMFYKDRLMEVLRYLNPDLLNTPESILLTKFEDQLGPCDDRKTFRDPDAEEDSATMGITHKAWLWCDCFTEQVLWRLLDEGEVRVRSTSRIYRDEMYRELTNLEERAMWESLQGLQVR